MNLLLFPWRLAGAVLAVVVIILAAPLLAVLGPVEVRR